MRNRTITPVISHWILTLLLSGAVLLLTLFASAAATPRATAAAQMHTAVQAAVQVQPQTTSAEISAPQACTPTTFGTPNKLTLTSEGLTAQNDTPVYFRIYGATANQLRMQVEQCGPGTSSGSMAEFTSTTNYNLTWQYVQSTDMHGVCLLTNVQVGLHTGIVLPRWNEASGNLGTRWNTFITNLTTHEEGHVAIDNQYASALLNDLTGAPCSQAKQIATAGVAALNNANDAYDAATNHGATQGAVFPE